MERCKVSAVPILLKFKKTITRNKLIQKGDRILIGVSGGPDSVALLYLLKSLKNELGLSLHIAHFNHMLRPDSSKDEEFVSNLAAKLKIPFISCSLNIRGLSQKGSLEEVARNARFKFFFRAARKIKADKIALGHNLDDQAETVLMRLLRGTGLYGLSAILPKRNIFGYKIIRPLIEIRRKEIETYLKKRGIMTRQDLTNYEERYFRNKIRHRLLPLLEKEYNQNINEILSNVAESSAYDYDYLISTAELRLKQLGKKINIKKFLKLHTAIQRLILRLSIMKLKGNIRQIDFKHIKEIEDMIAYRPDNSIVDLPKGISVVKKKGHFFFFNKKF
ncbi:MAG: tRNA lysidine(34) synthetase TilS [Candidatus Omnitrophica bacterium]|nr:tRNA lysidine(34) synthetase TilS [Candidatus Omnitrophota bacterium]